MNKIPPSTKLSDSVWDMGCNQRVTTGELYKFKADLNAHGGQQVQGMHYWLTDAPVVTWVAIRLVLTLVLLYKWVTLTDIFVLGLPTS